MTSSKPFSKCILHIGCEKTGTSTVQRFLSLNRPRLKREGLLYPVAGGSLYGGSQWGFAAVAREEVWLSDLGRNLRISCEQERLAHATALAEAVLSEKSALRKTHTLVVSSEHFHSRLKTRGEIERLRVFFEPLADDFQVVLYFRRQDRVAVSLFSTHIKSGNPSPRPFLPALHLPETHYYNYAAIYQDWSSVFGSDALTARIFHPTEFACGALLPDFCAVTGINFDNKMLPERQNQSFDPAAARFLIQVNRLFRENHPATQGIDRTALVKELERCRPGKTFPIDRETAEKFFLQFEGINQQLKELAFPDREEPVFDSDFSEYPETRQIFPGSYKDAVEVGLDLFQLLSTQLKVESGDKN